MDARKLSVHSSALRPPPSHMRGEFVGSLTCSTGQPKNRPDALAVDGRPAASMSISGDRKNLMWPKRPAFAKIGRKTASRFKGGCFIFRMEFVVYGLLHSIYISGRR